MFGEKEEIQELIEAWDHLFQEGGCSEESEEEINDISIIKTKNEGVSKEDKENSSKYENGGFRSDRVSVNSNQNGCSRNRYSMEKSYQKKSVKSTLERSGSQGRMSSKRQTNYISEGLRPVSNFFEENQSLSVVEEKRLVDRLYRVDIYRER